jgi:leucine dehydrogenase
MEHEELHVHRGERSGLQIAVAVHSTALGPALGGARLWRYESPGDGVADVLRLSEAMTHKAAAAGLDLGGGKSVICAEGVLDPDARREAMLDLGDLVESLDGRYVVAEDVGTGTADMTVVAERTGHVVGLPPEMGGTGDPSPVTARGVHAAIEAACERALGRSSLDGVSVCVVGLGHVGHALAQRLAAEGARVAVSDIDEAKRLDAARIGADWVDPGSAMWTECDVLAPCALGGAVDRETAARLRCAVLCGSANNVLAEDSVAEELAARGVLYVPDFIANSGGLINVYAELRGLSAGRVGSLVDGIGSAVGSVLDEAERTGATPLAAAYRIARDRLGEPARLTA